MTTPLNCDQYTSPESPIQANLYQSDYGWEMSLKDGSRERGELYVDSDLIVRFRPDGTVIPPSTVGPDAEDNR